MLYGLLADLVVVVHLGFIAFVAVGGFLAWRWPRLLWLHVPAVTYALVIVTVGFDCPLTPLEKHLRHAAGQTSDMESSARPRWSKGDICVQRQPIVARMLRRMPPGAR